jgi:hypothetical protein
VLRKTRAAIDEMAGTIAGPLGAKGDAELRALLRKLLRLD